MSNTFKILANSLFGVMMTRVERFKNYKIVTNERKIDKQTIKPNFISRNNINENLSILEMEKLSVVYSYPILVGSIILQNSKVHMYNYLYKIYPRLFGDNYRVLYMDTDSIYAKLNMNHEEYIKILENNKDLFGDNLGQIEIDNESKMKNNIFHTKGILNSYSQQYIDHNLLKETLLNNNNKPNKISFNTISVKNQKITTKKIIKNNIEFLNDKRYIKDLNSNIPHTLYIE